MILIISYSFYLFNNRFLTVQLLNDYKIWNLTTLEYFIPIILLPIGVFNLFFYKKTGWFITNSILMYFLSIVIYQMILEFKWSVLKIETKKHDMIFNSFLSGNGMLLYILQVAVLSTIIIYLNTNEIKSKYIIDDLKKQFITLLLPVLIVILYVYAY